MCAVVCANCLRVFCSTICHRWLSARWMEQGMLKRMMIGESIRSLPATYNKENTSMHVQRKREVPTSQPRNIPYIPTGISARDGGGTGETGFVNAGVRGDSVEGGGNAHQSRHIDSQLQDLIRSAIMYALQVSTSKHMDVHTRLHTHGCMRSPASISCTS